MKVILMCLFVLQNAEVSGTGQNCDILIFRSDTIGINTYPLDSLIKSFPLIQKKIINYSNNVCGTSSCWRGYIGTWKIINDSLFLTKLTNGCEDYTYKLNKLFNIRKTKNGKIFANWFTGIVKAEYDYKYIFINGAEKYRPTKLFKTKISNGRIETIEIENISFIKD